jgi:hypothetical protein
MQHFYGGRRAGAARWCLASAFGLVVAVVTGAAEGAPAPERGEGAEVCVASASASASASLLASASPSASALASASASASVSAWSWGAGPRRGGGDEPLDPRSSGWAPGKTSPLPWILIGIGAAVVVGATVAGLIYWNDRRAHFPNDTLGVMPFRP